jgi:hypothetical protein
MKKRIIPPYFISPSYMLQLIALFGLFISCEEPIELTLDTFEELPVIQANFEVFKDSTLGRNLVVIRKTNSFYEVDWRNVENAKVSVRNTRNDSIYPFEYFRNGLYFNQNLVVDEDTTYELKVDLEGEFFQASAKATNNSPIETIKYVDDIIIEGDEYAKFNVSFKDNVNERNFYLFLVDYNNPQIYEDTFFNGQNFSFSIFKRKSDLINNELIIQSFGIDKAYYSYLEKIIELNSPQFYGPFSTPPPGPVGNIKNMTDSRNFAFGYFQISVVYEKRFAF